MSAEQVQAYKHLIGESAERLVIVSFPARILELNGLLQTPMLLERNIEHTNNEPMPTTSVNEECRPFASGATLPPFKRIRQEDATLPMSNDVIMPVPCNKVLVDLTNVIKPIVRKFITDLKLIKMWISCMIPKIEDGNNFGVSVQQDTLAEIIIVETEASNFLAQMFRYYVTRGKLVSKVAKYPHIDDYRRSIDELDEKQGLNLWLIVCVVRNRYTTLHDMIIKNLEKLKKPRPSHIEHLY